MAETIMTIAYVALLAVTCLVLGVVAGYKLREIFILWGTCRNSSEIPIHIDTEGLQVTVPTGLNALLDGHGIRRGCVQAA